MADFKNKTSLNVDGLFFVDDQCIACDACTNDAPNFFQMSEEAQAYVYNQPKSQIDRDICQEALEICPVDAIGINLC